MKIITIPEESAHLLQAIQKMSFRLSYLGIPQVLENMTDPDKIKVQRAIFANKLTYGMGKVKWAKNHDEMEITIDKNALPAFIQILEILKEDHEFVEEIAKVQQGLPKWRCMTIEEYWEILDRILWKIKKRYFAKKGIRAII